MSNILPVLDLMNYNKVLKNGQIGELVCSNYIEFNNSLYQINFSLYNPINHTKPYLNN